MAWAGSFVGATRDKLCGATCHQVIHLTVLSAVYLPFWALGRWLRYLVPDRQWGRAGEAGRLDDALPEFPMATDFGDAVRI